MNITGITMTILLSAFTGWITTWVAIKMLFHPRNPIKILGFTVQGIFPKNQRLIAQKLAAVPQSSPSSQRVRTAFTCAELRI